MPRCDRQIKYYYLAPLSKLIVTIAIAVLCCNASICQAGRTVILQPGPDDGKDADIFSHSDHNNLNFGESIWLRSQGWTRGGAPNILRGLIDFPIDQWVLCAQGFESIESVVLTLYMDPDYPWSNGGAYGANASYLHPITEQWEENEVTWNTQPLFDASAYIYIPTNNSYVSIDIDVTDLILDRLSAGHEFYGFLLKHVLEAEYRSMTFFSSDGPVPSLRPRLAITYKNTTHPDLPALSSIYNALGGSTWKKSDNWLTSCDPCDWLGVTCNAEGRVIGLDLSNNGLSGTLPPEMGQLTELQNLDLGQNKISGEIPVEIYTLSNLTTLHLHNNVITGQISQEIQNLSNLEDLDLSNNSMDGGLPSGLCEITTITKLMIENNDFGGPYPPNMGNLCTQLLEYNFSRNNFFCDLEDYCTGNCQDCITIGKIGRYGVGSCFTWEKDGIVDGVTESTREVCVGDQSIYKVTVSDGNGNILSECEYKFDEGCMAMVEIEASSHYLCGDGDVITLDAGPGYKDYQWSTGSKSQTIQVSEPGEYNVVVTEQGNCVAADLINIYESNIQDLGNILKTGCVGTTIELQSPIVGDFYQWSTGETHRSILIDLKNTMQTVDVIVENDQCHAKATFLLKGTDIGASIEASRYSICEGELIELRAIGVNVTRYEWKHSGQIIGTDPILKISETGEYLLHVFSESGCEASDEVVIESSLLPTISVNSTSSIICEGDEVEIHFTGANSYSWTTGYASGNTDYIRDKPKSTTTYTVEGMDLFGCSNTNSITVTVKPRPIVDVGADLEACEGQILLLNATGTANSYQWIDESNNVLLSNTAELELIANDDLTLKAVGELDGCTTEDKIHIVVSNLGLKSYFETNGFFALPITVEGPITLRSGTGVVDDYSEQFIKIENSSLDPATQLDDFLNLNFFTDSPARGFVTKNENFCESGNSDLINIVKQDFESSEFGYWLHLWKDPDGLQDLLFLKCKKSDFSGYGPSDQAHRDFISTDLEMIMDGTLASEFSSMGEHLLHLLLIDLNDSYVADYETMIPQANHQAFSCGTASDAIFVAPSSIPFWIPSMTAINFSFKPEFDDLIFDGAVSAFYRWEDHKAYSYRGFVKDGGHGGYFCINCTESESIYNYETEFGFPSIPIGTTETIILGFDSKDAAVLTEVQFEASLFNPTTAGPYVQELEGDLPLVNSPSVFEYSLDALDEILAREGHIISTEANLYIDQTADGQGGIFFRVYNSKTGTTDWIYGYYDFSSSTELTYLRWNERICNWQIFDPGQYPEFDPLGFVTAGILAAVVHTVTEGKHDILAALSFVPVFEVLPIPDLLDAFFYFIEGDRTEGYISLAAALPGFTWIRVGTRLVPHVGGELAVLAKYFDDVPFLYSEKVSEVVGSLNFAPLQAEKFDQWLRSNDVAFRSFFRVEGGQIVTNDRFAEAFKTLADTYADLNTAEKLYDPAIINKTADLMENPTFITRIGGSPDDLAAIIRNNVFAGCNGCTGSREFLKSIDQYLVDLEHFVINYHGIPGFEAVTNSVKTGATNTVDGAAHMLDVFKKNAAFAPDKVSRIEQRFDELLDLEADDLSAICSDCKFDVYHDPMGFSEFKSYRKKSIIGDGTIPGIATSTTFRNQFMRYLAAEELESLNDLKYVFNKRKADLDGFDVDLIKMEFQKLFQDNANLFFKSRDMGGVGAAKMEQLFGTQTAKQFKDRAGAMEFYDKFYDFIKIL